MSAPIEVLVTSDSSGQLWNMCVWDVYSGAAVANYKGGCSTPHTLSSLAGQYFISASNGKSLVHFWAVQKKDQHHLRIVCPGIVSSLIATQDGLYCIAGIAEKIYVWQVSTGNLLAVLSRHYQTVTCLSITDDSSHFVSGGDDNLVMVWSMARVLQEGQSAQGIDPVHIWSNHSLPITDLYCTSGGVMSRVISASQDQSCKVWDLYSGELLCNLVFDAPIYSVCMDPAEYRLFAGSMDGSIIQANLFTPNMQRDRHIKSSSADMEETGDGSIFRGHSKQVTCLSVSLDGSMLVSGSEDQTVRIWNISSKQCIRTINHKGPVTNALIIPTPPNLLNNHTKPTLPIQSFKRHLYVAGQREGAQLSRQQQISNGSSGDHKDTIVVRLTSTAHKNKQETTTNIGNNANGGENTMASFNQGASNGKSEGAKSSMSVGDLEQRVQHLQHLNKELYTYAAKQILDPR